VHQLVNKKNFNNIKMHGMYVKIRDRTVKITDELLMIAGSLPGI